MRVFINQSFRDGDLVYRRGDFYELPAERAEQLLKQGIALKEAPGPAPVPEGIMHPATSKYDRPSEGEPPAGEMHGPTSKNAAPVSNIEEAAALTELASAVKEVVVQAPLEEERREGGRVPIGGIVSAPANEVDPVGGETAPTSAAPDPGSVVEEDGA